MLEVGSAASQSMSVARPKLAEPIRGEAWESQMTNVTFYIGPHQDDWQLFRGEQAYLDIQSGARVVFIYLTAGDAGGGPVPGWWSAREQGALESCRLATGPNPLIWGVNWFNGRPITGCDCGNTTSYFLRLPDGSLDGLRINSAPISAIDGSTSYLGWEDVCQTLKAILDEHKAASTNARPYVNAPDYDVALNPEPNTDHTATGFAVLAATPNGYNRAWWVGYDIGERPENIDSLAAGRKRELQQAYTGRILKETTDAGSPYDDWAEAGSIYEAWIKRSYSRSDSGG